LEKEIAAHRNPEQFPMVYATAAQKSAPAAECFSMRVKPVPEHPAHPERICWGCDRYCPADDLTCGNGTIRTPHPVELFGDDWLEHERNRGRSETAPAADGAAALALPL
jgi:hypothetical protein